MHVRFGGVGGSNVYKPLTFDWWMKSIQDAPMIIPHLSQAKATQALSSLA